MNSSPPPPELGVKQCRAPWTPVLRVEVVERPRRGYIYRLDLACGHRVSRQPAMGIMVHRPEMAPRKVRCASCLLALTGWRYRPDLSWCCGCGFNASIETRETPIGTQWLCRCCGGAGRMTDVDAPRVELRDPAPPGDDHDR